MAKDSTTNLLEAETLSVAKRPRLTTINVIRNFARAYTFATCNTLILLN